MLVYIIFLITDLLLPTLMIVFGLLFLYKPPKTINYLYGYRTKKSMISQESWDYAHQYFGKIWFPLGVIVLILTIVAFIFLYNQDEETVGVVGFLIMLVQLTTLMVPTLITEKALKRKFDNDGKNMNQ